MSHVHRGNLFRGLRFLEERIDRLVVNTVKEILEFRERLVYVRSKLNLTGCSSLTELQCYSNQLTELDLSNWNLEKVIYCASMFGNNSKLENIKSFKNLGKGFTVKTVNNGVYKLNLSSSTKLSHDSLIDIITNGLYDLNLTYDVANGGTLYTQSFNIGGILINKLTPEEIAIATNKGWTVS